MIPEWGRYPGEENGYPFQYSCLENSHGQRSLVAYSPWGHKESNTAEQLTLLLFHFLGQLKAAEKFYQTDGHGLAHSRAGNPANHWLRSLGPGPEFILHRPMLTSAGMCHMASSVRNTA